MQIVGARPQFIKLAPLTKLVRDKHHEVIVHSGQHYDYQMNDVFFSELGIPQPDYHLGAGTSHDIGQIAHILTELEGVLRKESPDIVIVYGDTNTTLAGALASARCGFPVAHVEAGLRSYNTNMPEESNRVLTDHLSDILFMPTQTAMDNASKEGLAARSHLVGDIMVDSLILGKELASNHTSASIAIGDSQYWLLTLHRPYNVDNQSGLLHILDELNSLGHKVLFPVHPRTQKTLSGYDPVRWQNVRMIEPQSYISFISLMTGAGLVITDSGGIQKEAYILEKPCVTLRTETEWPETVDSGWNLLLAPDAAGFPGAIADFVAPKSHPNLYGSSVAEKILNVLEEWHTRIGG